MSFDDPKTDGKSQPGTFTYILGGEERFKDPLSGRFIHADPCVSDTNLHISIVLCSGDGNGALLLNGLDRVVDNIEKNLVELADLTFDQRYFPVFIFITGFRGRISMKGR